MVQEPAVDDMVFGLLEWEPELFHVRSVQTDLPSLAGQRHEDQTRLLSACHHVAILGDHKPVSTSKQKDRWRKVLRYLESY